jgi:hypothetical protein
VSLVKEDIKQMFHAKKKNSEKVHAKKDNDSDLDIKDFFKDLSESDNNERKIGRRSVDNFVVKQSFIAENNSKRTLPTTLCSCQTNKKAKNQEALVLIVFAQLKLKIDPKNTYHSSEAIKLLLKSGASATLLQASWLPKRKGIKSNNKTDHICRNV